MLLQRSGGIPKKLEEPSTRQEFGCAAWSPDGSKIAYASGNSKFIFGETSIGNLAPCSIWGGSTKAGQPVRVTDDKSLNVSPAWMPDGRHLLYVSSEMGGRDVYLAPLDSSGRPLEASQRLTTGLNAHTITLSSAGDKLAYSDFSHSANIWSIRIPQDGPVSISEAQPVTTGNQAREGMDVSPDGKWLVYDSNLSGNQDIYKIPVGGGEPEQLTDDPSDDFLPAWSKDGRTIYCKAYDDAGQASFWSVPASGGKPELLVRFDDPSRQSTRSEFASDREIFYFTLANYESDIWVGELTVSQK